MRHLRWDSQSQQGGHGHGHYGGHGCGDRGHQGGHGNQPTTNNGVDISNLSCSFMRQEWEALGDGTTLFDSCVNVIRVLGMDWDPPVMAEVAETIMNILLLQLKWTMQTQQRILPLPVTTMTTVDIMDVGLVMGFMVGAMLDSLGH